MDLTVPQDLKIDDEPLDGILYGIDCPEATPADILERWHGRSDIPLESLDAILAILAHDPEKGKSMESWQLASIAAYVERSLATTKGERSRELLKLACICHAAGCFEQAEATYRQILEQRDESDPLLNEERWRAMNNLAGLLNHLGRSTESRIEQIMCEGEMLLDSDKNYGLDTVRSMAHELFVAGRYNAAERFYRGLLMRRYQQPGTLIHLARVLLMQDRLPEAREAIAKAWRQMRNREVRQVTPCYVLHRIIFFRIFCAMLARGNYSHQVAALKRELLGNPYRESWTIDPVIKHFKAYLRPYDVHFLESVAGAINSVENMDRLNAFEVWTAGEDVYND